MGTRIAIAFFTAVLLFGHAAAQAASLSGTVVDSRTSTGIPGAAVVVNGLSIGATTGEDGSFVIASPPYGTHKIVASMVGYHSASQEITIERGQPATVNFTLHESAIEMGTIVVTGTRTPRFLRDVPVRTEVVTSERIEARAASNLFSALEGLPGVRVQQDCSICNFSQVRMLGLESGHTQVLIDGQPVYTGLAGVYGLDQIPASNIDRIEVVKGAGSAMYGASAIAGVINVITKEPGLVPSVDFDASLGTHGTNRFSGVASRRMGNTGIVLTAQKHQANEIDADGDGITDRVHSNNVALGVRTVTSGFVADDDKLTLSGRITNESRRGGDLDVWRNPFAEETEHINTQRYELGAGYSFRVGSSGQASMDLSHTHHDRDATNPVFIEDYEEIHGTFPDINDVQPFVAEERLYAVNLTYTQPISIHRITSGIEYTYNTLDETGRYVIVDDTDPGYGGAYTSLSNKHAHDVGFYVHNEVAITNDLELTFGARYDIHRSEDEFGGSGVVAPQNAIALKYSEESFNPRAAVRYQLNPSTTLRASVGTGFRVPFSFAEDLHLCSGSPRVNKPAELEPERSISYSVSADYATQRVTASVNLFRTDLRKAIGFTDASDASSALGYTYEWANLGDAYTQGVEVGLRTMLVRDLVLGLDAGYTDARYTQPREDWADSKPQFADDSKYIPRVPELTGGIDLTYSPRMWEFNVNALYTGRMYLDYFEEEDIDEPGSEIVRAPDFWVVNAKVTREVRRGLWLYAGVNNLLDYTQEDRRDDDPAFIYAPLFGRITYVGLRARFAD